MAHPLTDLHMHPHSPEHVDIVNVTLG